MCVCVFFFVVVGGGGGAWVLEERERVRGELRMGRKRRWGKRREISSHIHTYLIKGDWVAGKREGRGEEQSQYGQYKGGWKADMKQGVGEERDLVGTIFEGSWDKGRKHGRGVRKMIFGTVEEQVGVA